MVLGSCQSRNMCNVRQGNILDLSGWKALGGLPHSVLDHYDTYYAIRSAVNDKKRAFDCLATV